MSHYLNKWWPSFPTHVCLPKGRYGVSFIQQVPIWSRQAHESELWHPHNEYRQVTNIIPCYNGHCNKKWTDTFFSGLYGFCSWSRQTSLPRYTKGWLSIYCKARTLPWMSARRQTGWVTDWVLIINSFTPVRSEYNFRYVIFKLILVKDGCGTYLLWNCPQINATGPYFWW